ncbi:MAG: proteobacterial dedicated sortase system response regulator [Gammaproteobacteria bacterium]|nr:MAG: proteobacterial dedicated sortase system response regulator [Gammaproteobacteria bacterium]
MNRHIAIVEDEAAIRDNYRDLFSQSGYEVSVYDNRSDALSAFDQVLPDLVIIDVGLKDEIEGGFDLCRELREKTLDLPIIFLTARDNELDAISGLRLGADDYLTKDISMPHLLARVVALFRRLDARSQSQPQQHAIHCDQLTLDLDRIDIRWQGQEVDLTLTEFWMVHALVKHPGHVKSRQQLMDAASVVLDDNTITSHIKRIRKKFIAIDKNFDAIQTVYGIGYRWHNSKTGA